LPNIRLKNTSLREVENIIRFPKTKESHSYDKTTTKILKISAPFISSLLSYIFNKSIISGIFPTRLKYATIKPTFKNGDKTNVAHYRPISILPSFLKNLEKIIYITLINHLETNNILAAEQFSFRTSSSTAQVSFIFINNILNEFKKRKHNVGSIFLDLQKAFDCVNHILLNKLSFYGIAGEFFQLIKPTYNIDTRELS
jgi:hypothetical protein